MNIGDLAIQVRTYREFEISFHSVSTLTVSGPQFGWLQVCSLDASRKHVGLDQVIVYREVQQDLCYNNAN